VRDRLGECGWVIEVADARKVKAMAPNQHFDVPDWVQSVDVTATGAAGEGVISDGGRGAVVSGTLNVGPGCGGDGPGTRCEDLWVGVGDVGRCNGAGGGASSPTGPAGGGGGGVSDVRVLEFDNVCGPLTTAQDQRALGSRLIVAAAAAAAAPRITSAGQSVGPVVTRARAPRAA
jgi:hypothetical protein